MKCAVSKFYRPKLREHEGDGVRRKLYHEFIVTGKNTCKVQHVSMDIG